MGDEPALEETVDLIPPGVRVITLCDREADIYEFFAKAVRCGSEMVVRAAQNRKLVGEIGPLWDYMDPQPVVGHLQIEVSKKGKEPARKAIVEVRFGTVTLEPPLRSGSQDKKKLESITIDVVWVKEVHAPAKVEPVEWMLLTNVGVRGLEDGIERVSWYHKRAEIESYHKVLKSGYAVEDCRLGNHERLKPYLILCSIIAWRLFWMTKVNREQPDAPCSVVLAEDEWKALDGIVHRTTKLPEELPTVKEVIRWIGQLGGFLGRKGDREPGITVIWRGWQRLTDISATWRLLQENHTCG